MASMSDRTAVQQAIDLLAERLTEARHARDSLTEEIRMIEEALTSLATVRRPTTGTIAPSVTPSVVLSLEAAPKLSVRAAVKHLLDNNDRPFTSAEIRDLIPDNLIGDKPRNQQANVVRTALWSLRKKGEAVQIDGNKTISTKWTQTTEGSSAGTEEPSDESQQEGGGEGRDHPDDIDSSGHGQVRDGRDRDDHAGALVGS